MSFLSRIMVVKSKAHFSAGGNNNTGAGGPAFEGTRKRSGSQACSRVAVMICCFGMAYAVIGGRLSCSMAWPRRKRCPPSARPTT